MSYAVAGYAEDKWNESNPECVQNGCAPYVSCRTRRERFLTRMFFATVALSFGAGAVYRFRKG